MTPPTDPTATASADPPADSLDAGLAAGFGRSAATTGPRALALVGQVIAGRYRLLEAIGEGGMGSVWLAQQSEPVKRKVAVKLIKAGMDSRSVMTRFEAERQALALMDHPNIAKILDGGLHDNRPYFVMELVKGVPITDYCDAHKLTPRQRLELFAPVCQAIQHAHQKGVIHRDIKPSNVLIALYDDKPVPKVIDFGVAKATGGPLTEHTIDTGFGGVVGTPQYMSPEQATLNNVDIDTRSDVYSLGVLLYELLAGSPPFARKELEKRGLLEILRVVREEEPPRPSAKLSTADALPSLSANRATEPRVLTGLLRNELDWIVMKALEKDRTRRYETANGFAADVNRYLSGEAVLAHPPSNAYRVTKFVRRHKGQVVAAGLVLTALLLGLAGTGVGLRQALIARADEAAARIEAQAESARATQSEAETAKRAAELKLVADFQGQMLAQTDAAAAGLRLTADVRSRFDAALAKSGVPEAERGAQREAFVAQWGRVNATDAALELIDGTILKPAAAAIDKQFAGQPAVAATLRHVLAERYHDLGLDAAAVALERQALAERRRVLGEDHPDTIESVANLGVYLLALGRTDEASPYYREALDTSRRVWGNDHPRTLTCIANTGNLLVGKGQLGEAEGYLREALEGRRRVLGEDHPNTLQSLRGWGNLLMEQGKLAEATLRDALSRSRRARGDEHPSTLTLINELAAALRPQGKLDEAVGLFREVTETRRRLLGDVHPATLSSIQNLGTALDNSGQPKEAEALLREALANKRRLLGSDHSSTLATLGNLAVFLIGQNKLAEAEPLCRETLDRRHRVLGGDHSATLVANNVMGLVLIRQGKLAQGEPYWREALATARRVLGPAHPDTLTYLYNLAGLAVDQKKAGRGGATVPRCDADRGTGDRSRTPDRAECHSKARRNSTGSEAQRGGGQYPVRRRSGRAQVVHR